MKTAAANMFRRRSDRKMKLDAKKYDEMRKAASPPSPLLKDCLWAFFVGGAICLLGEGLRMLCDCFRAQIRHLSHSEMLFQAMQ